MFYFSLTNRLSSGLTGLSNDIVFYFFILVVRTRLTDFSSALTGFSFIFGPCNDVIVEFHCSYVYKGAIAAKRVIHNL